MEDIKEDLPKPILIEDLGYLYPNEDSKQKRIFGVYKCGFCGTEFKAQVQNINRGLTLSCGCYHKKKMTKHGLHKSKLYEAWNNIKIEP